MKKLSAIIICLCILLCGCTKPQMTETQSTLNTVSNETTAPNTILPQQEAMYAVSIPTISDNTYAEDGTVIFSYTHQSMMLTVPDPEVANKVIIDFLSRNENAAETAKNIRESAKKNYTGSADWTPYLYNITYSPMRMDQGVLSLFGSSVTYSGASHPERLGISASYDMVTGDVLTLGSIMTADATTNDYCALVLKVLQKIEETKYLYEGYEETVKARFSQDESLDQDWYFSTTGLCFYFVPYEIAPYSSGVIVAEIPYSDLAGLLYDGYFPAEREAATGNIQSTTLNSNDPTQFSQIAELILNEDDQMIFLHTNGILWDVKLDYGAWDTSSGAFVPVYTALFSASLSPGDAIMVQTDEITSLQLTYTSGTDTVTQHFTYSDNGISLVSSEIIMPL